MKPIADPRYSEASAPPQISRFLLQHVAELGRDPTMLCRGLGFEPDDLKKPDYRLSYRQSYLLVRRALHSLGDSGLGLAVGHRQTAVSWGLVGMAMLASPTLGDALQLAIDHPALLGSYFQLALQHEDDEVRLVASGYRYAPELTVFNTELCLASLLTVIQDLLGEAARPRRLLLNYRPPLHAASYSEKLGCPVEFGAGCNALCFNPSLLKRALPLADPVSFQHGLQQCLQQEAQFHNRQDLRELIRQQLASDISQCTSLERVAARLHRSARTLRRHLQQLNTSFQHLLDEVRYDKARQLLLHTDLPIYLIAEQLGYSESASSLHAFQRWSGLAPSDLRR